MNGRQVGEFQHRSPKAHSAVVVVDRERVRMFFRLYFQLTYNRITQPEELRKNLDTISQGGMPSYLQYQIYRKRVLDVWEEIAKEFGLTELDISVEKEIARVWQPPVEKRKAKRKARSLRRHK